MGEIDIGGGTLKSESLSIEVQWKGARCLFSPCHTHSAHHIIQEFISSVTWD